MCLLSLMLSLVSSMSSPRSSTCSVSDPSLPRLHSSINSGVCVNLVRWFSFWESLVLDVRLSSRPSPTRHMATPRWRVRFATDHGPTPTSQNPTGERPCTTQKTTSIILLSRLSRLLALPLIPRCPRSDLETCPRRSSRRALLACFSRCLTLNTHATLSSETISFEVCPVERESELVLLRV